MEIGGYLSDWLNVSLNMRWEWIILLLKSSHYAAYADSYFVFSYCVTLYLNLRQMSTDAGLAVCIWNSLCVFQWLAFRSSFKMGLTQDEFSVTVNSCAGRMDCQLWHPISETAYGHKMLQHSRLLEAVLQKICTEGHRSQGSQCPLASVHLLWVQCMT